MSCHLPRGEKDSIMPRTALSPNLHYPYPHMNHTCYISCSVAHHFPPPTRNSLRAGNLFYLCVSSGLAQCCHIIGTESMFVQTATIQLWSTDGVPGSRHWRQTGDQDDFPGLREHPGERRKCKCREQGPGGETQPKCH